MKTYHGRRTPRGYVVTVHVSNEPGEEIVRPLNPRFDIRNHSPTGFEWGYGGSGPAQLALAICADALGEEVAPRVYQEFKRRVIAALPHAASTFDLTLQEVLRVAQAIRKEQKREAR